MSKKMLEYIRKDYIKTRTMPASWYLSSYKYKYNFTHFQPFFKKLKEKKLVGMQCRSCNKVSFPPKPFCGNCLVKLDRWVDIRDTGQLATFSITYEKNPETGETAEKPVACIRLDGSDTTFLAAMDPKVDFKDAYVGMPVKAKWVDDPQGNFSDLDYFEPIEDESKDLEQSNE